MLKTKSNPSRKEKKSNHEADVRAMHEIWYRRLCDIINETKCDPRAALEELREEVKKEADKITPQRLAQYKDAWKKFLAKIPPQN